MVPITIYAEQASNRFRYACYLVFEVVLKIHYQIQPWLPQCDDIGDNPCVIYAKKKQATHSNGIFIQAHDFLFEKNISPCQPTFANLHNLPCLFVNDNNDDLGFDIFSATFFMVSRYEEYLPFVPDAFGRFPEALSTSGKFDFTHLPIVHFWAFQLCKLLGKKWPNLPKPVTQNPTAVFTYDIDVAYAFKGRSIKRTILSFVKDIANLDTKAIYQKLQSGFGVFSDPSDTYGYMFNHPIEKMAFFLLAEKNTTFDHNLSPKSKELKKLIINTLQSKITVGIHPSFYSSEREILMQNECKTLQNIINQKVTRSRQHFLKFKTPATFQNLIANGILDDYSMQYPEMPGFRAGICMPYRWFDLEKDTVTQLTLHPGCLMETTFRDDIHVPKEQVLLWFSNIWDQVKAVGGEGIFIWHNDSFSNYKNMNFKYLHDYMINLIQE